MVELWHEAPRVLAGRSCVIAPAGLAARWGDPVKLQTVGQFSLHDGMPPPEVKRGSDGELVIYDGVTRASRAAKYMPGVPITVEVTGNLAGPVGVLPKVGDKV
jgi:hypothetical protein